MNSAFSYNKLLNNVKASLSRLGVEYVDVFTQPFAASRESVLNEPVMRAMEAL
jgi:diketogulonate reductase-like aldo/keto reductase